jgi:hypothetical protein
MADGEMEAVFKGMVEGADDAGGKVAGAVAKIAHDAADIEDENLGGILKADGTSADDITAAGGKPAVPQDTTPSSVGSRLDPKDDPATGRPTSYQGKSAAVKDILSDDGALIGEEDSPGVRIVDEAHLQQARADLTSKLGPPAVKATPKGDIEVWTLSEDPKSTVTYRPFSKSGGPTLDMNNVDGLDAKRLHIAKD